MPPDKEPSTPRRRRRHPIALSLDAILEGKAIPLERRPDATVASIPDEELLRRAVETARARPVGRRKPQPRWVAVMGAFMLGSTYAHQLCRRFGLDPDEEV